MYVFVVCSCILHHFSMSSREIKSLNQGLNHLWHGFFTVLGMASKIAIKTLGIGRGVLSLMTGILHKIDCETLLLEPSCWGTHFEDQGPPRSSVRNIEPMQLWAWRCGIWIVNSFLCRTSLRMNFFSQQWQVVARWVGFNGTQLDVWTGANLGNLKSTQRLAKKSCFSCRFPTRFWVWSFFLAWILNLWCPFLFCVNALALITISGGMSVDMEP